MVNCPTCAQPISAGKVTLDGVDYHPKCFTCKKCNIQCRPTFYQKVNGKFYCQNCVDKNPDLYQAVRKVAKDKEAAAAAPPSKPPRKSTDTAISAPSATNTQPKKKSKCMIM